MSDAVIEFAKWAIQESVFDGYDLDGGIVQEKALELGLLTKTSYDPEKHGEDEYAKPGSDWYVFSNLLNHHAPSPAPEAQLAEKEAEVERLRNMLNGYGKLDAELAIAERRIEALSRTGAVKVKALEWEETHSRRSDEDPTTEWNGGFEADSALGYYEISMGVGSDAYYWAVTNPLGDNVGSDFEDPSYAKAAAQADYERRILSAIEPAAPEGQQPVAWRWKPKDSAAWIYDPKHEWLEAQSSDEIDAEPLYTRPTVQAVTEAMVRAAAEILIGRVNAPEQEIYRAAAAALKAAMEAGRQALASGESR